MKSKLTDLSTAARKVPSGSSIAIGGSIIRRQPTAFARELIRNGIKNLTIYGYPCGLATDMLAGVGAVKRIEAVYTGLFEYGMAYNIRRGVESGAIEMIDFPEVAQCARFQAAEMGLPFLPTRTLKATGMAHYNPEQIKEITCPFTGEKMHAVPAINADFTVLHGYSGDEYGNVQWPEHRDADDLDPLMAKAAGRLIVTVEKIVPHSEIIKMPNSTYIPHHWVEAIVEVPFGAHPAQCDAFYDEDETHLEYYQECARDPQRWVTEYAQKYIYGVKSHEEYLNLAVSPYRLAKLIVR
jgi:glutaconate CoA-transferase subunit A